MEASMGVAGLFSEQRAVRMKSEEESSRELLILQEEIGSTLASKFIDIFNYESTLLNRFGLQFHYHAPWGKLVDPFAPDIVVFKCAKRQEFWKFCSDKIESIFRFISKISPQSGIKYLNNSSLIVTIQTTTTDMYTLKEVSRLPLSYLRYIKTCQYSWLTMTHLVSENGLDYCELTKLKPLILQALSFLRQYFFSDAEFVRDALAPSLEPVVVFVYRAVNLGFFNSMMLEDHSIDLMKKCLSLDNNKTETLFRILITVAILNKLAVQNVLILDANGVTERVVDLLEVLMQILKNGESSIYWIVTIDSIFITASQYLNMALSNGLTKTILSRINKIMSDYLEHTFSDNLFFKRPVHSVICLYANCLLADEQLDLKMVFDSIDALEMKLTKYNSYFCGTYGQSTETTHSLSSGANSHEIEKIDLSYSEDDPQSDHEDNCTTDGVDQDAYTSSVFDENYDEAQDNANSYREDSQLQNDREDDCIPHMVDEESSSVFDENDDETEANANSYRKDTQIDRGDNCTPDSVNKEVYSSSVFAENDYERYDNSDREDAQIHREDNCIPERVNQDAYSSSVFDENYYEKEEINNSNRESSQIDRHDDNCIPDSTNHSSSVYNENYYETEEINNSNREDSQIDRDDDNCIPDSANHSSSVFDENYNETEEINNSNGEDSQIDRDDDNCIPDTANHSSSVFDENYYETGKINNSNCEDSQMDRDDDNCIPDMANYSFSVFDENFYETEKMNNSNCEDSQACQPVEWVDIIIKIDRDDGNRIPETANHSSSVFDENYYETEKINNSNCEDSQIDRDDDNYCTPDTANHSSVFDGTYHGTDEIDNSYHKDTKIDREYNCNSNRVDQEAYASSVIDGTYHETDEIHNSYHEDTNQCKRVKLDAMIKIDREDICIPHMVDEDVSTPVFDEIYDETEENAKLYRKYTKDNLNFSDEVLMRRGPGNDKPQEVQEA